MLNSCSAIAVKVRRLQTAQAARHTLDCFQEGEACVPCPDGRISLVLQHPVLIHTAPHSANRSCVTQHTASQRFVSRNKPHFDCQRALSLISVSAAVNKQHGQDLAPRDRGGKHRAKRNRTWISVACHWHSCKKTAGAADTVVNIWQQQLHTTCTMQAHARRIACGRRYARRWAAPSVLTRTSW